MKLIKNTALILALIIILASFLRLPYLDKLPFGITIDEAGQGYSAYSILKTGKDEWGDFMPLNPRGFGDYKPPVFMYLLVPSIAVFGLSEFAVRLPSAIAGILTVWVFYFLVKALFKEKTLGFLAAFLLAISPWHVYYSRLGWESNVGLFFFCCGIWLFLKSFQKGIFLPLSLISFGLSTLSYHSFKMVAPLMIIGLIVIFRKEIQKLDKKTIILSGLIALIFVLFAGYGFLFSGAGKRVQDQFFAKEENLTELRKLQYDDKLPQPFGRILNNKYQFFLSKVVDNYLAYYSYTFIFSPNRSISSILNFPGKGLLYIWQLPLLILGIIYLAKNNSRSSNIIFLWLVIAPIPATLAQDYMHAGRAQALFPALTIISSIGLIFGFKFLKSLNQKKLGIAAFTIIVIFSLVLRIDNYFFHTFNRPLGGLVQGYPEIIKYAEENKDNYKKIVFTKAYAEPQAFFAFYKQMDPVSFQSASQDWKRFERDGFRFLDMTDYSLGNLEFRFIDISRDRHEKDALLIGTDEEIAPEYKYKKVVKALSGKTLFIAIDTNEIPP